MARPKKVEQAHQMSIKLPGELVDLADRVAAALTKESVSIVTKTDVIREAVKRGLAELQAEHLKPGARRAK